MYFVVEIIYFLIFLLITKISINFSCIKFLKYILCVYIVLHCDKNVMKIFTSLVPRLPTYKHTRSHTRLPAAAVVVAVYMYSMCIHMCNMCMCLVVRSCNSV